MRPVRPIAACSAGALSTLVTAIVWKLVQNSGESLPRHSWWEVLVVIVLGGCLAAGGWRVRDQVRLRTRAKREADAAWRSGMGESDARAAAANVVRGHEGPSADASRRVVVLAQAAAVGGAVLTGWYLAQVIVQIQRVHVPATRDAVLLLGVLSLAGAALSVLGFVVQRWCTIPDDEL